MNALSFDGEALRLLRDAPIPARADEALVQVIAAGICNTDLEITRGYASFRGTLGHEFVGRVIESPDTSLIGKRVVGEINAGCGVCLVCRSRDARHCPHRTVLGIKGRNGAFAEFLSLPIENLLKVPDELSDDAAVFVEPMAAALHILEQVSIGPFSRVAVIGDGKLAQLIVRAIAGTECLTVVIGKHRWKLEVATRAGAHVFLIDPDLASAEEIGDRVLSQEQLDGFDVVIEASGSPTGLDTALAVVKPEGTVVLKSTHHQPTPVELSLVVVDEVTIIGSRCGRFQPAIERLVNSSVDVSELITARFPLDEGVFAFAKAAEPGSMKIILSIS